MSDFDIDRCLREIDGFDPIRLVDYVGLNNGIGKQACFEKLFSDMRKFVDDAKIEMVVPRSLRDEDGKLPPHVRQKFLTGLEQYEREQNYNIVLSLTHNNEPLTICTNIKTRKKD